MKTFTLAAIGLLFFSSCNFNRSINKDLDTGSVAHGNGLSCDDIRLFTNLGPKKNTAFVDGERVTINFIDMKGFTKVGGKFYFGLSIEIRNKSGELVDQNDDVFSEDQGFVMDPITVTANFTAFFDEEKSKDYVVKIKIWDKKGKGTFDYELPYSIKPNKIVTLKPEGLSAESVRLFDTDFGFQVAQNLLIQTDKHEFKIVGLKGFVVENGKAFIDASIKITDAGGNALLDGKNLFSAYNDSGVSAADVSKLVSITFNLGKEKVKEPILIKAVVTDLKSGKKLMLQTKMELMR